MSSKIIFTGLLVALVACQDSTPSARPAVTPEAMSPAANKPSAGYVIDTSAVLTNRRLDQLLTDAQQANLVAYQSAKALPSVIVAFLKRVQREPVAIADFGQVWPVLKVWSKNRIWISDGVGR